MKKFIRIFVVFLFVSLPGYFVLVYTVRSVFPKDYAYLINVPYVPLGYGHLKTRIDDIKNYTEIDALVIGSSHAYRGYDPRIFKREGLTIFNLGSSSQSPIQSYYLLKKYIEELDPKLVIIEVFPETFTSDGIESTIDLTSNCPLDMELMQMTFSFRNIKPFNAMVYRIIDQEVLNHNYYESKTVQLDRYISGGYVEREMGHSKPYVIPDSIDLDLDENQLIAFEKSLDLLKDKGIRVILVQAPVTKKLYNAFREEESFNELMSGYGEYYNFNEIELLQDSILYYDSNHLNQNGVEEFNEMLLDTLIEKFHSSYSESKFDSE